MDLDDAGHATIGNGGDGIGGEREEQDRSSSDGDHGSGGGSGSKSHHHRHSSSCTTYHASNISYQQSLSYRFGVKRSSRNGGGSSGDGPGSRNGCLQVTSIIGMLCSMALLIGMLVRILTIPSWQSHGGRIALWYPGETRQLSPIVTQWDDASMRLELAPVEDHNTTTTTGLAMKVYYIPPPPQDANAVYNNNKDDKAHSSSQCHFPLTGPTIRRQDMFHRELKPQSYQLDSFYLNHQSTLHVDITPTLLVGSSSSSTSSSSSSSSSSWTTIYLFQGRVALDWLNGQRPEQQSSSEGAARSAQDGGDEERFWNSALWVQSLQNSTSTTTTATATTATTSGDNATTTTTSTTMAEGGTSNGAEPHMASLSLNYTVTESDYYSLVYNNDAFWETSPLQVVIDILETTHDLSGLEPYCILYPTTSTTMTRPTPNNSMPNDGGTRHSKNRCFWNFYQDSDNQEDVERAKRELEGSCIVLQAVSSSLHSTTTGNASTGSNQTLLKEQHGLVGTNSVNDPPVMTVEWKST
jgi:hypothetical protein